MTPVLSSLVLLREHMSNKPVLCIQVNEETQLRLLEERHVEQYFALIGRNKDRVSGHSSLLHN